MRVFSLFFLFTWATVHSYSSYRAKVPNGVNSPGNCYAWGHTNCASGGGSTKGSKVLAGATWSISTCKADPDGDGYWNGEELGDACCYGWAKNSNADNVDNVKGVNSNGGSDTRISNPRVFGNVGNATKVPIWSAAELFNDGDIRKYHTAQPGAFTITTATRSVRIF